MVALPGRGPGSVEQGARDADARLYAEALLGQEDGHTTNLLPGCSGVNGEGKNPCLSG